MHCILGILTALCVLPAFSATPVPTPTAPPPQVPFGTIVGGSSEYNAGTWGNEAFLLLPLPSLSKTLGLRADDVLFLEPHLGWQEDAPVWALGLGFRRLITDVPNERSRLTGDLNLLEGGWFYGANLFVDGTRSDNEFCHWGLSAGVEFGTRYLSIHANYYQPLTDARRYGERHLIQSVGTANAYELTIRGPYDHGSKPASPAGYSDINVHKSKITTYRHSTLGLYEEALAGWDTDVSLLVPKLDRYVDLRIIAGLYGYQDGEVSNGFSGWRTGLELRPVPSVVLMGSHFEDDRTDAGEWFAGVRFEIPFGASPKELLTPRKRSLRERLYEPVSRNTGPTVVKGTKVEKTTLTTSGVRVSVEALNLGFIPQPGDWIQLVDGTILVVDKDGKTLHQHRRGEDPDFSTNGVIAVVPEPGRALLIAMGLAGTLARIRRSRA